LDAGFGWSTSIKSVGRERRSGIDGQGVPESGAAREGEVGAGSVPLAERTSASSVAAVPFRAARPLGARSQVPGDRALRMNKQVRMQSSGQVGS
jgi:hypothetical protein